MNPIENIKMRGESVIYSAKPKQAAFMLSRCGFLLPIAIVWLAFDSAFIKSFLNMGGQQFSLFLIPFFLLHLMPVWLELYFILTAPAAYKRTEYYITNQRVIIRHGVFADNFNTIYYKDIHNVSMRVGLIDKLFHVGSVSIDTGRVDSDGNRMLNTSFNAIEDYQRCYKILQQVIFDIQTDIEYPNAYRPKDNPGYQTDYTGRDEQ